MKHLFFRLFCCAACTISANAAVIPISITSSQTSYSQNFNNDGPGNLLDYLGTTPSANLPQGWALSELGTSLDNCYLPDDGHGIANTFSYGAVGSPERALGMHQNAGLVPRIGLCLRNDTGATITTLAISYVGEEWHRGVNNRADSINFEYSYNATSPAGGGSIIYTPFHALDFQSPTLGPGPAALNGNSSANRRLVSAELSGLSFQSGTTMWLRWTDTFLTLGENDGLAIDDFSLSVVPEPVNVALAVFGGMAVAAGLAKKNWKCIRTVRHFPSR